MRRGACAAVVAGLLLLGSGTASASPAGDRAFEREFGERFLERYWAHDTDSAIAAGHYRHAGVLNLPDPATRAAFDQFCAQALARLARIAPESLSPARRTDRALLQGHLEATRWRLATLRDWEWDPSRHNVAEPFGLLLGTDYAPLEQRLRAISTRLERVPAYYAAARASIRQPTREHVQLAALQNEGALSLFGEELERAVAGSALRPEERALFLRRLAAARDAIGQYVAWLKALDAQLAGGGARPFRLGKALYEQKFAHTIRSGFSAEALYRRALAEKERLHARMDGYTLQLWPQLFAGETPPADRLERIGRVIGKLSERHVAREEFVDEVKRQIPLLERWVTEHELLELDPSRPLQVRETPPYQRGVAIASINPPGPYNPGAHTWYNVTPLDGYTSEQAESFLREYNHWIMQILNIHEAVPGHYVQLLYSNRSPSLIKSLFANGAMVEGWAVYAERMMLESGWGGNAPDMWLMYSKWNLRSVCNTILDYAVHVLGMPEDEALRLLTREAFQSETEARGKWRRVQLTSVQLTSYFAGYAEIWELREALRAREGAAFDLKRFHERFLSYGSAPVGVIKELMMPPETGLAQAEN